MGQLKEGTSAPLFEGTDQNGNLIKLGDFCPSYTIGSHTNPSALCMMEKGGFITQPLNGPIKLESNREHLNVWSLTCVLLV